jgi:N-methylhydantoinase B
VTRNPLAGVAGTLADPVEMEVFSNRLLSITEEMNNTLVRSSFSTNIKERRDCSVALFDGGGRLIAQGTQQPLHLGSLSGSVRAVLARFPVDSMEDGDAFICNDPYVANGTHLPDISVVTPVFVDGAVRFFAANVGHHSDVGGAVPGSIAGGLRSIFAEGIRIPAVRIARDDVVIDDMMRLITCNVRDPEERRLDLCVQIGTNRRGRDALLALVRQSGIDTVMRCIDDLVGYTRRRIGNRIGALRAGTYAFESFLDDDGLGGDAVPLRVAVTVGRERLHFDFTGSGPQARGGMNMPRNALEATVYYAVTALLDPEIPVNEGLFEPIDITLPPRSILNPEPPAPVGARSITAQKLAGTIFGAFRGLLPEEKVMASSNDCCPAIVFSGPLARGGEFVYMETMGGGAGARFDKDGTNAIHVHVANTSNLPIEALENEHPLRVDSYALVTDSSGAGRTCGGMSMGKQIRALVPGIVFSARSDSHTVGVPTGVFGGRDGRRARLVKVGPTGEEILYSKIAHLELAQGESIRLETAGGGGFGDPRQRSRESVERDLREGRISPEHAQRDYEYVR